MNFDISFCNTFTCPLQKQCQRHIDVARRKLIEKDKDRKISLSNFEHSLNKDKTECGWFIGK